MSALHPQLRKALTSDILSVAPHVAVLYDLDQVRRRIAVLRESFPGTVLHALAVKACPLTSLIKLATDLGCGAEVASASELHQSLRVGVPAGRIVFDSPAKTMAELRHALSEGVLVNADNLQEIDRIAVLVAECGPPANSVGVRINPESGSGSIQATSTAMRGSKFGVSLSEHRAEVVAAFDVHPWLKGVHVHVGSQGCDLDLMTESIARVLELVEEIEARCGRGRVEVFDIGGGLSVSYGFGKSAPDFGAYARALEARCPRLFSGDFRVVTEFGRAVWANAAIALSRVEYTKISGGRRIATIHLGADMFVRPAYMPDAWRHEISVLDADGHSKRGPLVEQDIAGPLCFSGDLLARSLPLPLIEPGDHVVVHDVGAYTLSMWSHYNSRLSPTVYGFNGDDGKLIVLRKGCQVEDSVRFWD